MTVCCTSHQSNKMVMISNYLSKLSSKLVEAFCKVLYCLDLEIMAKSACNQIGFSLFGIHNESLTIFKMKIIMLKSYLKVAFWNKFKYITFMEFIYLKKPIREARSMRTEHVYFFCFMPKSNDKWMISLRLLHFYLF